MAEGTNVGVPSQRVGVPSRAVGVPTVSSVERARPGRSEQTTDQAEWVGGRRGQGGGEGGGAGGWGGGGLSGGREGEGGGGDGVTSRMPTSAESYGTRYAVLPTATMPL